MRMTITRVAFAALLTGGALVASQANATLFSYSGLEGASVGSIVGVNDGTNWSIPWDTQNSNNPYQVANATPLTYSNLLTSPEGNYINGGAAYTNLGRQLKTDAGSVYDTNGYVSSPYALKNIDQGGALWFSILMRPTSNISSQVVGFTGDSNVTWTPPSSGDVVLGNDGTNWGIQIQGGAFTSSGKGVTSSSADLLVMRLELNGTTSSAHLWVNPASLNTADPSLASANAAVTGLDASVVRFKNIHMYLGNTLGNGAADELRVGDSYASVTPTAVPEPSSLVLLAGATLLMVVRRQSA